MARARRGNCYVTSEALYHLLGGKAAGWTPHSLKHEGHHDVARHMEITHAPKLSIIPCTAFPGCPRVIPCTCGNPAHVWQWARELQDYIRLDLHQD